MNSINGSEFGAALFGMLADIAGDIVLQTDPYGFIQQSSPGLPHLGVRTDGLLILPHVSDLSDPRFADEVRDYVRKALSGRTESDCVEFPLASATLPNEHGAALPAGRLEQKWFALRLRLSVGRSGKTNGALAMLRAIERPQAIGSHTTASGMIDRLTGLAGKQAFDSEISERIAAGHDDTLVMTEIDSFRSLRHRFGPSSSEEIICAFADFLLVMLGNGCHLSRLKDARFAFLLENTHPRAARDQVEEMLRTFAELSTGLAAKGPAISASAGLASLGESLTISMARTEKALILASTNGGSQAKMAEDLPHYLTREQRSL